MTITMIPLSRLVPSAANVRKTGATAGVIELAASIKAHGLLQNLQVRPVEAGKFEVVAGRRRLAALKRLARNKDIEKLVEIPCHIIEEGDAAEITRSMSSNIPTRSKEHLIVRYTVKHGVDCRRHSHAEILFL